MKLNSITVKLFFPSNKRPDIKDQSAIIEHINSSMEEWNCHVIDIEISASKEREDEIS
jgi:hypothetical protein